MPTTGSSSRSLPPHMQQLQTEQSCPRPGGSGRTADDRRAARRDLWQQPECAATDFECLAGPGRGQAESACDRRSSSRTPQQRHRRHRLRPPGAASVPVRPLQSGAQADRCVGRARGAFQLAEASAPTSGASDTQTSVQLRSRRQPARPTRWPATTSTRIKAGSTGSLRARSGGCRHQPHRRRVERPDPRHAHHRLLLARPPAASHAAGNAADRHRAERGQCPAAEDVRHLPSRRLPGWVLARLRQVRRP